ncbi:uncharacterized protein LOC122012312 isoform X2 [Zingiber officinale]|uniref:Uncharacterized protein n=1 Tax=Zingiber officinale TaxID=94328 RepID=A0A8J5KNB8_ZINOF|nr:uncharacterized protein LOC122012312 isoform X2 [Zingiber officinale]KAG6484879.1 hypothetical protein ZIOFF_053404 [Zingiber officinale]
MFFLTDNERRPPETATALAKESRGVVVQVNTFGRLSLPIMETWGNQRVLRCVGVNGKGEGDGSGRSDSAGGQRFSETEGIGSDDPEGGSGDTSSAIEEVREKLLVHLREAADRIKLIVQETPALPPPPSRGDEPRAEAVRAEEAEAEPSSSAPPTWPWKLRTRRRGARVRAMFGQRASGSLAVAGEKRAARPRSSAPQRGERSDFSITLTREEIDEDIYAVTGYRARRRPRRRPRVVQKQLDLLFPGSWLSEITYDSYKVTD